MAEKQTKYRKGEFITVPNRSALRFQKAYVQSVFMWLCKYADEDGICFPSRAVLAKDAGTSVRSVDRAIAWLEENGMLTKKIRKSDKNPKENTSNLYQINEVYPLATPSRHPSDTQSPPPATPSRHPSDTQSPPPATPSRHPSDRVAVKGEPLKGKPKEGKPHEVANGTFAASSVDFLVEMVAQYHRKAKATYNPRNKAERAAAERILGLRGLEGAKELANKAFSLIGLPYVPQAPTLFEMDKKAVKIMDAPPNPNGYTSV